MRSGAAKPLRPNTSHNQKAQAITTAFQKTLDNHALRIPRYQTNKTALTQGPNSLFGSVSLRGAGTSQKNLHLRPSTSLMNKAPESPSSKVQ